MVRFQLLKAIFLSAILAFSSVTLSLAAPMSGAQANKICAAALDAAQKNNIDPHFFARLLWRESLFDPNVISDQGAQGIAQFMPGTAKIRSLDDPFDPYSALPASASYLSDLIKQYGNMGLAAVAYNAGEGRLVRWLGGKSGLPEETENYVMFITGHEASAWKNPQTHLAIATIGKGSVFENCIALASRKQNLSSAPMRSAKLTPWGSVLSVNFNEAKAIALFKRLKLRFPKELANLDPVIARKRNLSRGRRKMIYVMLGAKTQSEALIKCEKLERAGVPCLVRKN